MVRSFLFPDIAEPCEMFPVTEVSLVEHVGICLAFKGEVGIGPTMERQPDDPFNDIPEIEEDDAHLQHLCRMDTFVADEGIVGLESFLAKQNPKQVDGVIVAWRQYVIVNDNHFGTKIVQASGIPKKNAIFLCIPERSLILSCYMSKWQSVMTIWHNMRFGL